MDNYIFFTDEDDQDAANDAAMFPATACAGLTPTAAGGTETTLYLDPRDNQRLLTGDDATTAYNDSIALTHGASVGFDVICQEMIQRINAKGPFTVVCDIYGTKGADANVIGDGSITHFTACAITSAD